jgi:hypothetical protein
MGGASVELRSAAVKWPQAGEAVLLGRARRPERRVLRFFGLGESSLAQALAGAGGDGDGLEMTICARDFEIHVDLLVDDGGDEQADRISGALREALAQHLFAEDERTVAEIGTALNHNASRFAPRVGVDDPNAVWLTRRQLPVSKANGLVKLKRLLFHPIDWPSWTHPAKHACTSGFCIHIENEGQIGPAGRAFLEILSPPNGEAGASRGIAFRIHELEGLCWGAWHRRLGDDRVRPLLDQFYAEGGTLWELNGVVTDALVDGGFLGRRAPPADPPAAGASVDSGTSSPS